MDFLSEDSQQLMSPRDNYPTLSYVIDRPDLSFLAQEWPCFLKEQEACERWTLPFRPLFSPLVLPSPAPCLVR